MGIPSNPNPPLPSFTKGGNKYWRRHKWRLYTNGQAQDLPLHSLCSILNKRLRHPFTIVPSKSRVKMALLRDDVVGWATPDKNVRLLYCRAIHELPLRNKWVGARRAPTLILSRLEAAPTLLFYTGSNLNHVLVEEKVERYSDLFKRRG